MKQLRDDRAAVPVPVPAAPVDVSAAPIAVPDLMMPLVVDNPPDAADQVDYTVAGAIDALLRGEQGEPTLPQTLPLHTTELGADLSDKVKATIWTNEYVDFYELVNTSKRHQMPDYAHPLLSLIPQGKVKQISSIEQWTSAFLVFGAVYTKRFPDKAPGLFKYCEVVRDIANTGPPFAWRQYDEQFRAFRHSNPPSFPCDQPRWDLFFKCMYAKQVQGGPIVLQLLSPATHPVALSPFRPATAGCTSEGANVSPKRAGSNMSVPNVKHLTLPLPVPSTALPTQVNSKCLQHALQGYDQTETNFLIQGFTHGFHINYLGTPSLRFSNNHPSVSHHKDVVERKLAKELALGRIAGPFLSPPFVNYQSSPHGIVPKKEPNESRIIHDLSYPDGNSINDYIPKHFTTVRYETLDQVITLLSQFGRGALIGKTDIEDAFRIIPLHPSCYHSLLL